MYSHLSAEERGKIEGWLEEELSYSEIARRLGRNRSTISREVKRGTPKRHGGYANMRYLARGAGNLAQMRKQNCGRTTKANKYVVRAIKTHLDMKWSPEQIANAAPNVGVSTTTIYRWIYRKIVPFDRLKLRHRGKRYKSKKTGKLTKANRELFVSHSIDKRPEAIQEREEFGHWEADTILSKRGINACLATFVERKTRKYVSIKIPRRDGKSMMTAVKQLIEAYPAAVRSVTCDRGSEFIGQFSLPVLEDTFGCLIYYADPQAPHQRGSNENCNGLLREYFPKPYNSNKATPKRLNDALDGLNTRPKKILNWKSPQSRFDIEYRKAKKQAAKNA